MIGIIKCYDEFKGFGIVIDEFDHSEYPFYNKDIIEGYIPYKSDIVNYETKQIKHGRIVAHNIDKYRKPDKGSLP